MIKRAIDSNLTFVQKNKWLTKFPYFSGKVKKKFHVIWEKDLIRGFSLD